MNRQRFFILLAIALVTSLVTGGLAAFPVSALLITALCSLTYLRTHRRSRAAGRNQNLNGRSYTSHNIPQSLKYRVMQASDGICGICTKPIEPDDEVEIDHKIPWSHGGETSFENLWVCHKACNRSKGNRFENA